MSGSVLKAWNPISSQWEVVLVGKQGPPGLDGTGSLFYGQTRKMTSGTITVASSGVYQSTGLTATFYSVDAVGVVAGTTDNFAIKNGTSQTRETYIVATYDAHVSGPSAELGLIMALNGTPIADTECRATTSASGALVKLHAAWIFQLAPNDEVALFVANHSSTTSINFERGRIVASGVTGGYGPQGPAGATGATGPAGVVVYDDLDNILAHQVFS